MLTGTIVRSTIVPGTKFRIGVITMKKENREEHSISFIIVFIVVFILMMITLKFLLASADGSSYVEIKIESGDTLWAIAQQYEQQHSYSTEGFIDWVEENNSVLANRIFPGQTLVIPVEKDAEMKKGDLILARQNE
jgi:cell division protein YceG involved in septum cleavage